MNKPIIIDEKTLSDIRASLDYILSHEKEDFENQCAEHDISEDVALSNPESMNHVYGFASRAWKALQ